MLSYQHAYHAGNHADILKHYIISFVIDSLNKKDKPYTFFDSHSGSGIYDLLDNRNLKTKEGELGIRQLLSKDISKVIDFSNVPGFELYLSTVRKFLDSNIYPGSPVLEKSLMRSQDILIASELHPQEYENLKENLNEKSQLAQQVLFFDQKPVIQVHHRSGWEMLKALTPPKTKRGAVIIDPSYEETDDYFNAVNTIVTMNKKWSNGIIMLWYPLLAHRKNEINSMILNIIDQIKETNPNCQIDDFRLCVNTEDSHIESNLEQNAINKALNKNPPRLYGSGMLVVNTPWKLAEETALVIPELEKLLKQ